MSGTCIISEPASISRVILEFVFALPVFACNCDASCSYAVRGLTRIVTYFFIKHSLFAWSRYSERIMGMEIQSMPFIPATNQILTKFGIEICLPNWRLIWVWLMSDQYCYFKQSSGDMSQWRTFLYKIIIRVKVTLRPTVGRSVSMSWCLAQSRTFDQSLLSLWNFF
jgi:hypothetical protein